MNVITFVFVGVFFGLRGGECSDAFERAVELLTFNTESFKLIVDVFIFFISFVCMYLLCVFVCFCFV